MLLNKKAYNLCYINKYLQTSFIYSIINKIIYLFDSESLDFDILLA